MPGSEGMAQSHPLLLDEALKATDGAEERVHH